MQFEDYYKVLGVSRSASKEEIQKAFRQKARKCHPDINSEPGAEEEFKKINEAYEVLKDPDSRQRYDALGANWKHGQEFRPPPGWGGGGPGGVNLNMGQGQVSDFFQMLFGQRAQKPSQRPTSQARRDAEVEIVVPLQALYHNKKHTVRVKVGQRHKSYKVRLPPGTTHGGVIRLNGQGPQAVHGGPRGDLRLRISVAAHPDFELQQFDLIVHLPLSAWEHALGAQVEVPTMDGPVQMKIPPLMPHGRKLRVKGRGLKRSDNTRANLYVVPHIVNPPELDAKTKALFEQLAKHNTFSPRQPADDVNE